MGELYLRAVATDESPAAVHGDFGEAARWSPQLVIVQVGGNDLYGGKDPPLEAEWVGSCKYTRNLPSPVASGSCWQVACPSRRRTVDIVACVSGFILTDCL